MMYKQKSLILNNKENNNNLINNIEPEEKSESQTVFSNSNNTTNGTSPSNNYSTSSNLAKILSTNTTIGNIHSARNLTNTNINYNVHQKNSQLDEKYDLNKNEGLEQSRHNNSNAIAQQLLNDVRALAAQNSKTEQNLKELQQKINVQKGKKQQTVVINNNNVDKENEESQIHQRQAPRTLSYNIQNAKCSGSNNIQIKQINGKDLPMQKVAEIPAEETTKQNDGDCSTNKINGKQTDYMNTNKEVHEVVELKKTKSLSSDMAKPSKIDTIEIKEADKATATTTTTTGGSSNNLSSEISNSSESISARLARVLINNNYSLDILNYYKFAEFKVVPKNCLLRHNIPASLRARMIDWMIEVTKSYKCSEETFFMAVRIMDHFFEKTKKVREINEIHLIGVTSLFIACKFEEIYPIRLAVLYERIAHKKLSEDQIKSMEAEILNTLQFNLLGTSPYDIAMQTLTLTGYQDKFTSEEFEYAHKICVYLCKMALYDYDFNKTSAYSLLAASVIFIIFKIFQQINPEFLAEQNVKMILQVLKIQQKDLVSSSTRILHLAKNFEQFFPDLLNLKKFNGFEMKENEDFANSN